MRRKPPHLLVVAVAVPVFVGDAPFFSPFQTQTSDTTIMVVDLHQITKIPKELLEVTRPSSQGTRSGGLREIGLQQ